MILFVPGRSHVQHATAAATAAVVLHELFDRVRRRREVHLHFGGCLAERRRLDGFTTAADDHFVFAASVGRAERHAEQLSLARADGYDPGMRRRGHRGERHDVGVGGLDAERVVRHGHRAQGRARVVREPQVDVQQPLLVLGRQLPGHRRLGNVVVVHGRVRPDVQLQPRHDVDRQPGHVHLVADHADLLGHEHVPGQRRYHLHFGAAHVVPAHYLPRDGRHPRIRRPQVVQQQVGHFEPRTPVHEVTHPARVMVRSLEPRVYLHEQP